MAALLIMLLTFTSCFVIDFLSIRKVIIFSAIATDDRHPPTVTFYTPKWGRCKSWTLDSGLDRGLDHGPDHGLDRGLEHGLSLIIEPLQCE